jgi:hypothetical protein
MSESAVFVDPTGRRRRTVRLAAIVGAVLLFGTAALLVAALLGAPIGPLTSLPEKDSGPPPAAPAPEAGQPPAATTTKSGSPGSGARPGAPGATTTTTPIPAAAATTTTRGSKPESPPGKPTDLPTPPGHTR